MSSDREGIKGGVAVEYSRRSVLAESKKYWQAEQGSVKGPGIKDKGKVSTTQSV